MIVVPELRIGIRRLLLFIVVRTIAVVRRVPAISRLLVVSILLASLVV